MTHRRVSWGLVALVAASAACFDSDDKFKLAATTTTGDPTTSTTTTDATTTTTDPTTGGSTTGPYDSCRDAIDCIFECAAAAQAQVQIDPTYEPDFSCFLDECIEALPVLEVKKLILLGNCAADECALMGECGQPDTTSTGGSGSDSGSSDDGLPPPNGALDPCIQCIFTLMLDEEYEGCSEFALVCE